MAAGQKIGFLSVRIAVVSLFWNTYTHVRIGWVGGSARGDSPEKREKEGGGKKEKKEK